MKNPLKALRMTLSLTCRAAPVENAMPELSVPHMSMVSPRSETIAVSGALIWMPQLQAPCAVLMTASTPSATMLIGLLMISGPKLPEFRTLIAPLLLVWLWAKAKVRHGAVLGQVPASLPVAETQVSAAACATPALTSRPQAAAKTPINGA